MGSDLSGLIKLLTDMPAFKQLLDALAKSRAAVRAFLPDAPKPYFVAALRQQEKKPILLVTAQPEAAKELAEQLVMWVSEEAVSLLPEPDVLPYQRVASDASTEIERVRVLAALSGRLAGDAPLVVASAASFTQKMPSFKEFGGGWHSIKQGMVIEPLELVSRWQVLGYRLESLVETPGTMAHRGGILDVFPSTAEKPVRLEFFGNTVESIRLFEPESQRSIQAVSLVEVGPAAEMPVFFGLDATEAEKRLKELELGACSEELSLQMRREIEQIGQGQKPEYSRFYASFFNEDSVLSYLPPDGLLVLDEPAVIEQAADFLDKEAAELRQGKIERGELPTNFPRPYFKWGELKKRLGRRLEFAAWGSGQASHLGFTAVTGYTGRLADFFGEVRQLLDNKKRVIISSHQSSRLAELLGEVGIPAVPVAEVKKPPMPGSLTLVQGNLARGWLMDSSHFYSDAELFGFARQRRLARKRLTPRLRLYVDIKPGDYVVHIDHGVALFGGITVKATGGVQREYLVLEYASGDRLYVPTDQIERVGRYIGAGDQPPVLNRLGTQEWARTRQKASDAADDIAEELLALYAAREMAAGFAFSPDTVWQQEFESAFPYVETPDQLSAQQQVKADMEQPKPMDRLVLGDVGYGKTEVAIRAAFKAVMDGKQVAVLVPTTVLAQQHFNTFSQRLAAFPVKVEVLSRFRTPSEQRRILEELTAGGVDIIIGTHRLLQSDVAFKNLGLLVVDEEQRFGVAHKEYLKQMRREVDVLTLSATPIPRTLHMSLVDVRDMSLMETPPEERLPVKTFVAPYDEQLVREAVLRELERNGQVFFVHNRVQSIVGIAARLEAILPEANVAVAHGQMAEGELEAAMSGFVQGQVDVLVCTTIIESGLDVPNANTLIINRADRFGLTQLYQLRGRVGRGANLAYAYLLYDKGRRLTAEAQKRLETMLEAAELGAGFSIAMKDLEIRGAGNLLGSRQSGHIQAVGFDLYTRLLADAVKEQKALKAGVSPEEIKSSHLPPPRVALPLPAFLPEEYIADLDTRLGIYRRLGGISQPEQMVELATELTDRFGGLPAEAENLLYIVQIKALAQIVAVESISFDAGEIIVRLVEGLYFNTYKLSPLMQEGVYIGRHQLRLNVKRLGEQWQLVLEEALRRLAAKAG